MKKIQCYHIQGEEGHAPLAAGVLQVKQIALQLYDASVGLPLNNSFLVSKYGFGLSAYERNQFMTHRHIWQLMAESDQPYCLISESTIQLASGDDPAWISLLELLEENDDWDIVFPFEATAPGSSNELQYGYLMGYPWRADACIISRQGIYKLLQIAEIRQAVGEEMLTLSLEEKLNIYNVPSPCISYQEDKPQQVSRQEAIRQAVLHHNRWTPAAKQQIRTLLKKISDIAIRANIKITLCDGSLLGHIRHGGIMPWDDDVDMAIRQEEMNALKACIELDDELLIDQFLFGCKQIPYYKIWSPGGNPIEGFPYTFPFVDIWLYEATTDAVQFYTDLRYPQGLFYPQTPVLFEGSTWYCPAQPLQCLDLTYSDWRTTIALYPWSHQLECAANPPLFTSIQVDENGRFIY